MDPEKQIKFLCKRQQKRIIQKHVNELLEELKYSQDKCIFSQPSTSYSTIHAQSDLYPHSNVNFNVAKSQHQNNESRDEESLNETSENTAETSEEFYNIISEIIEEPNVNEKLHSSHSKTICNTLINKLRNWSLTHNITLSALNDLLLLLQEFHSDIPLSGKSLLCTPRTTKSINLQNGEFTYFGICEKLNHRLKNESCILNIIYLDLNFDGLPLFKSSSIGIWPILCRSLTLESLKKPFIIGLFTGKGKPEPLDLYLQDMIKELNDIIKNNVQIDHKLFKITIRSLICDAPARAFVKCCVNHNSRHGCEKCNVEGKYINHTMSFPCISGPLRTKETFKEQMHEEHHKGISPLLHLDLDLVNQVPLDPMHLVYLGIMRKLLTIWILKGKPPYKLPGRSIDELSTKLILLSPYVPYEFCRKPRALSDLNRWKAKEFRLFLLYVGPVALINILPKQLYKHFLMLHAGITILCNDNHISKYVDFAEEVLCNFVQYLENSYGKEIITYNVHSLIHLVADVKNLGNLNTISCFPFENYLGKLKTLVRSPTNPHAQLCRRIHELDCYSINELTMMTNLQPKHKHSNGPVLRNGTDIIMQYKKLQTRTYVLSSFFPDNCVSIQGGIIVKVINILRLEDQSYSLICHRFLKVSEFYDYPCSSKLLNIFKVSDISSDLEEFPFASVKHKNVLLPAYENETYIVYPLLHEL